MSDNIDLVKIMNNDFMKKHTSFRTVEELFEKSEFKIETQEDFENLSEDKVDIFIKENTKFNSWEEILNEASCEYISKQLKF
jgi:hypothetical protein